MKAGQTSVIDYDYVITSSITLPDHCFDVAGLAVTSESWANNDNWPIGFIFCCKVSYKVQVCLSTIFKSKNFSFCVLNVSVENSLVFIFERLHDGLSITSGHVGE